MKICTRPWAESKPDITTNRSRRRLESDCSQGAKDCILFLKYRSTEDYETRRVAAATNSGLFILIYLSNCWLSWRVYAVLSAFKVHTYNVYTRIVSIFEYGQQRRRLSADPMLHSRSICLSICFYSWLTL
jgi:hypothetical protein